MIVYIGIRLLLVCSLFVGVRYLLVHVHVYIYNVCPQLLLMPVMK